MGGSQRGGWPLLGPAPLLGFFYLKGPCLVPACVTGLLRFSHFFFAGTLGAGRCRGPDGGVTTQNNMCVDTQALPEYSLPYSTGGLYVWVGVGLA